MRGEVESTIVVSKAMLVVMMVAGLLGRGTNTECQINKRYMIKLVVLQYILQQYSLFFFDSQLAAPLRSDAS